MDSILSLWAINIFMFIVACIIFYAILVAAIVHAHKIISKTKNKNNEME